MVLHEDTTFRSILGLWAFLVVKLFPENFFCLFPEHVYVFYFVMIYEQYFASKFSTGKSPFLKRSASNGCTLSRTGVLPLYIAVK